MSVDAADLDASPFFVRLKTRYPAIFNDASNKGWTICVPRQRSIIVPVRMLDNDVFAEHVLRPSPFLRNQFLTLRDKTVELDDERKVLITGKGFSYEKTVKILAEETFYNSDYKPYTVLSIAHRLDTRKDELLAEHLLALPSEDAMSDEIARFLDNMPDIQTPLLNAAADAKSFIKSYVIMKGYTSNASTRVAADADRFLQALVCMNPALRRGYEDSSSSLHVRQLIENYYLRLVSPFIMQSLEKTYSSEDDAFQRKIEANVDRVTLASLGVRDVLRIPDALTEAISELDELGRAVTPLDKCRVLQRSLQLMESGYLRHVKGLGLARDVTVATDDLIPLLAYLLVKTTKRPRVFSASIFIRDFLLSGNESSQINFLAVTFQAVLQFIETGGLSSGSTSSSVVSPTAALPPAPLSISTTTEVPHEPSAESPLGDFLSQLQKGGDMSSRGSYMYGRGYN